MGNECLPYILWYLLILITEIIAYDGEVPVLFYLLALTKLIYPITALTLRILLFLKLLANQAFSNTQLLFLLIILMTIVFVEVIVLLKIVFV